ncbi:MAG: PEP-CTERM sorting domain-containing protein [Terriglobia bacterium]
MTLGNMSGFAVGGIEVANAAITVPPFDPSNGLFASIDGEPSPISGHMDVYAEDTSNPGDNYSILVSGKGVLEFSINFTGTGIADMLVNQDNGFVLDSGIDIIDGTATVTYPPSPTPEPSSAALMLIGLAALVLIRKVVVGRRNALIL